jgi:AcrR family transcriptional regulator
MAAAARLVREQQPLAMRAVADAAGVSRSTLYRHFGDPAELQRALQHEALALASAGIEQALSAHKPPLSQVRAVVSTLVTVGARFGLDVPLGPSSAEAVADVGGALRPLAERLARAAALAPIPPATWLRTAIAHGIEACLAAGWADPKVTGATAERLLRLLTDQLDRGLLLTDATGLVVTSNAAARAALDTFEPVEPGRRVALSTGGLYEDGAPASPEMHPLNAAVADGEAREGIRGQRSGDGAVRWWSIEVRALRRAVDAEPYGFAAVFTDVSEEKRFERAHLKPPGELGAATVPLLDVVRVLDEVPPPLLPEQLIAEAMRLTGGPVALYVLDIDGSHLLRLAGREDFPARLHAPLALGPELAEDGLPALTAHLATELPGVVMAPMMLRSRAVGVLLALRGAESGLFEVARLGAAALQLAGGYTDVMAAAQRRKDMNSAAEIQQSLLPPRIARMGSGELAGSVLPSYDVGGDWFDYVENRDGAWIAIADAAGKGQRAAALSSVALAALRAARRNDDTLEQAVQAMHQTVFEIGIAEFFLTAIVARWHSVYSVFSWVNCGHPPPLLLRADGEIEELATEPNLPLGLFDGPRTLTRHQLRLLPDDRLVLYSDGIARRRTRDGLFGTEGIVAAASTADGRSATATVRAIQEAVVSASEDPLPDDSAIVVLATTSGEGATRGR